jgi:excisionase family DNA binding protein
MGKVTLSKIDFITISNIASHCGVSRLTVKRWIDNGQLHSIKLPSGHNRVTVQDLKIFLIQNRLPIPKELMDVD